MYIPTLPAHPPAHLAIPPETWQQVQALLPLWKLPRQRRPAVPAVSFAESLPEHCAPCLAQIAQIELPYGYAAWLLPATLLGSKEGKALRQFLLQQNWLDVLMPLYRLEVCKVGAPFWLLLLRPARTQRLVGFIGARPGHEPSAWNAKLAAAACKAFWERRLHPGYLPLPWDVALQELYRFGL